jgi:L-iditol 2-dehydrogenase
MKVARLKGAGRIEITEEPVPVPGPGESLVRVSAVGLCGSDLHWFGQGAIGDAVVKQPLVLGHEMGGRVVGGPLDGRLVAVDPAVPDNVCARCLEGNRNLCPNVRFAGHGLTDGGLREFMAWPTELLFPVPEHMNDLTVALLEPLGVALHAFDLSHFRFGSSVGVVGCGPIGLMLVQVSRAAGASRIVAVEPLAHRREQAARAGADVSLSPEECEAAAGELDVVFEVGGNNASVAESMHLVRFGGRVVLVGIPDDDTTTFPASLARRKGLTIAMSRRMKDAYPRAVDIVERKVVDLGPLVSATFALTEVERAFDVAMRRDGLKVVVLPSQGDGVPPALQTGH